MIKNKTPSAVSLAIRKTMFSLKSDEPLIEKSKKEDFIIKIANTIEEREAVFRLAYQVYLDKNYVKENKNEWLVNEYDRNESTKIFIVKDHFGSIVASATLVFNDSSILPTAAIYANEIETLCISGSKIVEVSRLIINPDFRNSKEILVLLFNYMFIYGYHVKHFDTTIIQVNPRHKEYYKSILCFEEIGYEKPCPHVQNAPAILLNLPLNRYQAEIYRVHNKPLLAIEKRERTLYRYFLKLEQEGLVASYLEKQTRPMTADEKIYFGFAESGFSKAVCV